MYTPQYFFTSRACDRDFPLRGKAQDMYLSVECGICVPMCNMSACEHVYLCERLCKWNANHGFVLVCACGTHGVAETLRIQKCGMGAEEVLEVCGLCTFAGAGWDCKK